MHFSLTSPLSLTFMLVCTISSTAATSKVPTYGVDEHGVPQTNPLWKCWHGSNAAPDKNNRVPPTHVCAQAWARGPRFGETAVKSYNGFSISAEERDKYLEIREDTTVGPWNCCFRCENDKNCFAWQIPSPTGNGRDCICKIFRNKVPSRKLQIKMGKFLENGNTTDVIHTSSNSCGLQVQGVH